MKMKKWQVSVLVCASLLCLSACKNQMTSENGDKQAQVSSQTAKQGEEVLDFELTGVDGKTYRLSDYKGKKVYLKFWASWCSICLASLPDTDELAKEANKRGIVLELNNSSLNPNSARQNGRENAIKMLEAAKKYGTNVICNTDSHYADSVGDFRNCDILLREMDFPQELILNNSMEKLKLVLNKSIEEM